MSNLYLDLYVLQSVPSSNLNRDDSGQPKTAIYGDSLRSRVSSQAWKHAMRKDFADKGHRTKLLAKLLGETIQKKRPDMTNDEVVDKVSQFFTTTDIGYTKPKKDKDSKDTKRDKNDKTPTITLDTKTQTLFFISDGQLNAIANYMLQSDTLSKTAKKDLIELLNSHKSIDQALFGRMVADEKAMSIDAASQVAHAISTHEIVPEFDYFTAADDDNPSAGAAMIGLTGYNSATLYRYANVNLSLLRTNLGDDSLIANGVTEFVQAFVTSMPSGKENSYANRTLPQYVLAVLRDDMPVNLVTAFETPVTAKDNGGFMRPSIEKLEKAYQKTSAFVDEPKMAVVINISDVEATSLDYLKVSTLSEMTSKIKQAVAHEITNL